MRPGSIGISLCLPEELDTRGFHPDPGRIDVVDDESDAGSVAERRVIRVLGPVEVQLGTVAEAKPGQTARLDTERHQAERIAIERHRGLEPFEVLNPHAQEPETVHDTVRHGHIVGAWAFFSAQTAEEGKACSAAADSLG
jgi:hypothetical protein